MSHNSLRLSPAPKRDDDDDNDSNPSSSANESTDSSSATESTPSPSAEGGDDDSEEGVSEPEEVVVEEEEVSVEERRRRALARFGGGDDDDVQPTLPDTPMSDSKGKGDADAVDDSLDLDGDVNMSGLGADEEEEKEDTVPAVRAVESPQPADIEEKHAAWENEMIEKVFDVTVDDNSSSKKVFLQELADELAVEMSVSGTEYPLNVSVIDRVLVARLSAAPAKEATHLEYLINCYKRIEDRRSHLSTRAGLREAKLALFDRSRDLVVSYIGLVLKYADMFHTTPEAAAAGPRALLAHIYAGPNALPSSLLARLASRFESDGASELFVPMLTQLSSDMRSVPILGEYMPYMHAFRALLGHKAVAAVACFTPNWLPAALNGHTVEVDSFLGPFFSLSPINDNNVGPRFFSKDRLHTKGDLDSAFTSLRGMLNTIQNDVLFPSVKTILKAGANKEGRESVLRWVACVAESNKERERMRPNYQLTSSDGFLLNLGVVLVRLCLPFIDKNDMSKIDPSYLVTTPRLNVVDDTKLYATSSECASWVDPRNASMQQRTREIQARKEKEAGVSADALGEKVKELAGSAGDKTFHFVTECFFLTSRILNVGLLHTINRYKQLARQIHQMMDELDQLKATEGGPAGLSAQRTAMIKQIESDIERLNMSRFSIDAHFLDPSLLRITLRYYMFVCSWLCSLADPNGEGIPLPVPAPMELATLPEHLMENAVEFVLFVARASPQLLSAIDLSPLARLVVLFVGAEYYIRNPYLRVKLVGVLAQFAPQNGQSNPALLRLYDAPDAQEHLFPLLMQFYVDVEHTGSHSEFYDKFSARHDIAVVFEHMWSRDVYRASAEEAANRPELFTAFANMLLNDTVFYLDESLMHLRKIHDTQQLQSNPEAWAALTEEERREKEQELESNLKYVKSWMVYSDESVHMLTYLSRTIVTPFMADELVSHLAEMVNHVVSQLVGPSCTSLKIRDPLKVGFNPRKLLKNMATLYLHFMKETKFAEAIVADVRSYSSEMFDTFTARVRSLDLLNGSDIRTLEAFGKQLVELSASTQSLEDQLGDIPDEFLDPLMCSLMRDPVILPSGNTMDRGVIARHLLSDQSDPFTRNELSMDMVKPNTELKAKIDAFIKERLSQAAGPSGDGGDGGGE